MQEPHFTAADSSRLVALLEENLKGQTEVIAQLRSLQASEFKYRTILEELDLGYMEVDLEGVVTHVHPRFLAMTGYRDKDLVGTRGESMLDEEGQAIMNDVIQARKNGSASSYEIPVKHRLGHRVWMLITGAPIRNLDGKVVGSVGIHFDITARKLLEIETNRALAAESSARSRERGLLMKMSHEIRTPINAINGMLHLMNHVERTPEHEAIWQGAIRATALLRSVVDDVLNLSKIEESKPTLKLAKINIVDVTSGVAKMHHLLAEEKGINLNCGCHLDVKNRVLDVDKWLQILTNLLGNAIKYTEEGTVTLNIRNHETRPDWIVAEVIDEGPGIPLEHRERIFQPFGMLESESFITERRTDAGSTGLGLSIARELARLMGGDIKLANTTHGAHFNLEIPARTWQASEVESKTVNNEGDVQALPEWDGANLRVLLAEDNDLNILYAKALMEQWNVRVDVAKDGLEALQHFENLEYDVVLLDVQMPNMDGLEVLSRIRREERGREQRVYMVTAFADEQTRLEAENAGANGFVAKPFDPSELKGVLASVGAEAN